MQIGTHIELAPWMRLSLSTLNTTKLLEQPEKEAVQDKTFFDTLKGLEATRKYTFQFHNGTILL
jgi:hypothetical protein